MTAIPFPVSSAPGARPQEGAGRLINCMAEKTGETARFPVVWRRTPGLRQLIDLSANVHFRGGIKVASTLIAVMDTRAYSITESGGAFTATNLGAIAGTGPITVAANNASTPNIVCVTADGARNLFTASAPSDFADADLPQPNSVSVLNGYFLFTIGDGRIFATGINNVSVATNSTATEQGTGGLLRGVAFRGEFFAFGSRACGVYVDQGLAPFPLMRRPDTIPRGIAGTYAVAGFEEGWANQLIWVGDDGLVYQLNGYVPAPISTEDVARDIATAIKAGEGGLLEASVYKAGTHAIWSLTNPGKWTWEYNVTTQNWHQRRSEEREDWRASRTLWAFNRWIAGDRTTGQLFEVDAGYYRESGDPLRMILRSGAVAAFPGRIVINRADFDFTAAIGAAAGDDPIQTDPTVLIRWSTDGGYDFGNWVSRKLGKEGEGDKLVSIARGCGMSKGKGFVFELMVADPVHVGFMGGQASAVGRTE